MAASTREHSWNERRDQPHGPLEYAADIVELDVRSNPRHSVASTSWSSIFSSPVDCLIPEWKAYAFVMDSFRGLNGGGEFSNTRNDYPDENLPL